MARKNSLIAFWFLWAWVVSVSGAGAAVQLDSLTVGYSSFSGHYTPVWIAVEDRLGRKYGLDLKVVYAGRMRPQQLLVSGEIPIVIATGSGALTSHILGVKDQVIVANFIDKVGGGIYARSEIKRPEDLRGKTVGVGRAGSISDSIARYVLRAKLGLVPDRDVKLLVVGEPALGIQALERGIVDAAPLSMPLPLVAKKMGVSRAGELRCAGNRLSFQHCDHAQTNHQQKSGPRRKVLEDPDGGDLYLQDQQREKPGGYEKILAGSEPGSFGRDLSIYDS